MTSTSVCQHDRQFCPGGWILFDGHCYLYVTSKANWADAEKDCNIKGGHLTSIHSDEENALIQGLPQGHLIWIGGSDADLEVGFTTFLHKHTRIHNLQIQGSFSFEQL